MNERLRYPHMQAVRPEAEGWSVAPQSDVPLRQVTDSSAATASPRRASHRFDNGLRYRDAEHPDNTQFTPARSDRVYLDGDQALFAGLVRMEFGPAARIVMFDGDDGRLYAEVEASHAGYVSDFRVVTEADRG